MAKMTLDQLRALRAQKQEELEKRNVEGKDIQVIVGMGTCGIAAGRNRLSMRLSRRSKNTNMAGKVVIVRRAAWACAMSSRPWKS